MNIPIIKPVIVFVLEGSKQLGASLDIPCSAGSFVLIANDPKVTMRNIPMGTSYLAMLMEFEFDDFRELNRQQPLDRSGLPEKRFEGLLVGQTNSTLEATLQQFIEWSVMVPPAMWAGRRKEILQLLYHQGYSQLAGVTESANLRHQLHSLISYDLTREWSASDLARQLAMSESSLRRKLQSEGTNLQSIKDGARLGFGLHLIQTTFDPIGLIAERCGYQSQSRFTDKFKQLFGMTPSELRKTRLHQDDLSDSGENLIG